MENEPKKREILTTEDVESKMVPVFSNDNKPIDKYLRKSFTKLYEKLKEAEENEKGSIIDELDEIWESYMSQERMRQHAIHGTMCAIIQRNLSHNLGKSTMFPTKQFYDFVSFCGVDDINIDKDRKNIFRKLLEKNSEDLKGHFLNIQYKKLREAGKSPIESIQLLPWGKLALQNMLNESSILPSREDTLQGSKMGDTEYCLGRLNTIIGIITLNEGIDYFNKHFKYVEVIKDGLEDILADDISMSERDDSYLRDVLNYEDPHTILLFTDDDGNQISLDTNIMAQKQLGIDFDNIENVTKVYKGDIGNIAYEIYFLDYLNTKFWETNSKSERLKIMCYVNSLNKRYGGIPTLLKRLISYANALNDVEFEDKKFQELKAMATEYPCIENTLSYQIKLNECDEELMNEFIHRKYGPQFLRSEVKEYYGL